jgi:hypothetical protein
VCFSPITIKAIKPRSVSWDIHIVRITEAKRNAYKNLIGKSDRRRPCGRPRAKWDFIIKVNFGDTECKVVNGIELAQVTVAGLLQTGNFISLRIMFRKLRFQVFEITTFRKGTIFLLSGGRTRESS